MLDAFELRTLWRTLLLPPTSLLLLAAVGLAATWWRRSRGRASPAVAGPALAAGGLAALWLLSTPIVGQALIGRLEAGQERLGPPQWERARTGADPPAAVVILGGGLAGTGPGAADAWRLHARTLERVVAGARVARLTGLPVLVSGGSPRPGGQTEAALMREVLQGDLHTPVRWVEAASVDTLENAVRSARMLAADGVRSIVLVTHAYHMTRARSAFEAAGLVVTPAPAAFMGSPAGRRRAVDWLPSASGLQASTLACHEWLGAVWYRFRRAD
jgi:uncharacterized SAM-binding protein YcdF (DUF218 family)